VRASLGFAALAVAACGADADRPVERVTIPPGASFSAGRDTLAARQLVARPRWFTLVARVRGLDRGLKAGVYDIRPGTSASTILSMMADGREAMEQLTIPEGLTLTDVADLIQGQLGIDAELLLAAAGDSVLISQVSPSAMSLEGFLYPETYTVPASIGAERLTQTMVAEFTRRWPPGWTARLDSLGMSRDEVVTLASIVEGEARVGDERATISGVYHNRIRLGMRLQADPTVQYAIQLATGQRKSRLFLRDYEFPSEYNTYLIDGLPPGPVSSPGSASIEAALYPADVPYLYFVADSTGRHIFTKTYREHLATIRRLRDTTP
jgi:UPF0755 protein